MNVTAANPIKTSVPTPTPRPARAPSAPASGGNLSDHSLISNGARSRESGNSSLINNMMEAYGMGSQGSGDNPKMKLGKGELLRMGSGADQGKTRQLQEFLNASGAKLDVDGRFGPKTKAALQQFQRDHNLKADGILGPNTLAALNEGDGDSSSGAQPTPPNKNDQPTPPGNEQPSPDNGRTNADFGSSNSRYSGKTATAKGTGYYPANNSMEGGFKDRKGKPLHTLEQYLRGDAPFVSVAMDSKAGIPYGQKVRIAELEKKYGRPIEFRVVDTGGAFRNKGTSRIDICTDNRRKSLDPTINSKLTLQFL